MKRLQGIIIGILIPVGLIVGLSFSGVIQMSWMDNTKIATEQNAPNYNPKNGYVPDSTTAIKIAEAVWLPIYGQHIYDERPFVSELKIGIWTVHGTLPENSEGGTAEIEISQQDGKILKVIHYK